MLCRLQSSRDRTVPGCVRGNKIGDSRKTRLHMRKLAAH